MTSPADEISQREKRRILVEESRLRTYHGQAQASIDEDRGGRFAYSGSSTTVTGASPISYPAQPAHSPWHHDPCPPGASQRGVARRGREARQDVARLVRRQDEVCRVV